MATQLLCRFENDTDIRPSDSAFSRPGPYLFLKILFYFCVGVNGAPLFTRYTIEDTPHMRRGRRTTYSAHEASHPRPSSCLMFSYAPGCVVHLRLGPSDFVIPTAPKIRIPPKEINVGISQDRSLSLRRFHGVIFHYGS